MSSSNIQILSEESVNHFYLSESVTGGLVPIGIKRRKAISAFQWLSNFVVIITGIIAFADICMSSSHADYYVYYTASSAAAAGYPFQSSHLGWIPYLVLQLCSVGFILFACALELRCYWVRLVGVDLKYDIYPFKYITKRTVKKSLWQAQQSFSPHGVAYDNYFYYAPLSQIVIIALLGVHLTFGFDIISFTPIFVTYAFCLLIILIAYMAKLFIFPLRELDRYRSLKQLAKKVN
jgi:hypothetical protein